MTTTELRLAVPETVSVAMAKIAEVSPSFSTVSCERRRGLVRALGTDPSPGDDQR